MQACGVLVGGWLSLSGNEAFLLCSSRDRSGLARFLFPAPFRLLTWPRFERRLVPFLGVGDLVTGQACLARSGRLVGVPGEKCDTPPRERLDREGPVDQFLVVVREPFVAGWVEHDLERDLAAWDAIGAVGQPRIVLPAQANDLSRIRQEVVQDAQRVPGAPPRSRFAVLFQAVELVDHDHREQEMDLADPADRVSRQGRAPEASPL